jgi:hypothetical protein|tara:strand:+ start:17257 stop:17517 length:261 start_codon:yes stop_codon:yes gene_type:complete
MVADWTVPERTMEEIAKAYRWYRECGDKPDRAWMHATNVISEKSWQVRKMLKFRAGLQHKHGRDEIYAKWKEDAAAIMHAVDADFA